ncbi:MAG: serine/threonine protein kinase [Acidobacteria bacterium]|nr:serine/threonine protein kinase [Acidobacteriota bacterium]
MPPTPDPESSETIAQTAAIPSSSRPSLPRLTHTAVEDEGRFLPGAVIGGRYRIIGLLGRGGMGEVYRATDLMLGQAVALKFLPDSAASNEFLLERFHGEVRVARQVSHPNVCRVYDIGEADGVPFISMEYVDGEDLASLLQRIGRLPADKALQAARQICAGLAAAHGKGVIHRDLKPQNIMMNKRGETVIMDFGLAAVADQISGAEARHGTPAYMSPEQLKGAEVTAKSDIYALGLVLYELFTGKRAFEAKSVPQLLDLQESAQLASMTSIAAEIDPAVEKVVRRCLETDPARRPATALAVSAALPGGDPLSAALAAGETPSPELVAAAGANEGLPRKYSIPCLLFIIATLIAMPMFRQRSGALFNAALEDPPDVLKHKARNIAAALGYPKRPADTALWLTQRGLLLDALTRRNAASQARSWLEFEAPLLAQVRESPAFLNAAPNGYVDSEQPPPLTPGMLEVQLEAHGRLRAFSAMPYPPGQELPAPVSVDDVFRLAGFDKSRFVETAPRTVPRAPADELHAWKGTHPVIPDVPITVEVGSWKGRITHFHIIWPWSPDPNASARSEPWLAKMRTIVGISALVALVFFGVLLARRNWKAGRVDRRGAMWIGVGQFLIQMAAWFGRVHATPSLGLLFNFVNALGDAAVPSAGLWLVYLALEPELRRRWPHTLVAWTRVLSGRWLDPTVGGHVLVGAATGSALLWLAEGIGLFQSGILGTVGGIYGLQGTRPWVGVAIGRVGEGLQVGLLVFFMLSGLRYLLRRDWIATIVGALAMTFTQSDIAYSSNQALAFGLYVVLYGGLIFALLRLGLVVAVAEVFFINTINAITVGADWTAWYAPPGLALMALVLGVALFSFRLSLGASAAAGSSTVVSSAPVI